MKIAVLGTGMVGQTLATKLASLGHEVMMGSREAGNEKAVEWAKGAGDGASEGSFADAAAFGELVINATAGVASLEALDAAGSDNLAGKVVLDVANPLDSSQGFPPTLSVCNDDSLGERIQAAFGSVRVVKSLNTVNAAVMTDPGSLSGPSNIFVCGNDDAAKAQVRALLEEFGWEADAILDVGHISAARGTEMYLPLWLRMMNALDTAAFNIEVVR